MMCPKCKREMEAGFLQCKVTSGMTWVSKLLPFGFGYWKNDAELVSYEVGNGITGIPAHICKHCKLLLGDYSKKE